MAVSTLTPNSNPSPGIEKPRLRSLEPVPLEHDGQSVVALRDPAGLCNSMLVLTPAAYHLTRLMNGERTPQDILARFRSMAGLEIPGEALRALLEQLDEALALDNDRSRAFLHALPARPMAHAGSAYPAEPDGLVDFLEQLMADRDDFAPPSRELRAVMVPHIDLRRGAESFGCAFRELRQHRQKFDTYVVLGISHAYTHSPFVLTRMDFETPLGSVACDRDFVDELAAGLDFDPFRDEFNQLGEHSIEFQAIFLKHIAPNARIVPILCGSFHSCLDAAHPCSPRTLAGVPSFLTSLQACLGKRERVCLLASVDLAHVGQRFGGPRLSLDDLERLGQMDQVSLEKACGGDAEGFIASLQVDGGERNYCGTSAIYTMLECLPGAQGQLHHYQQCNEPGNTSTVTVASAGYY